MTAMRPAPRTRHASEAAKQLLKSAVNDPVIAGVVDQETAVSPDGTAVAVEPLVKLTVRLDRELLGRVRAAYVLDGLPSGYTSLSGWVASVLADRIAAVETDRNGGAPLTPLGVDRIPKGRLS